MADREKVLNRRSEVEALMLKGFWSLRNQMRIAERHGVDVRTVYRDAAWIRDKWKQSDDDVSPAEQRSEFLARLKAAQADAASSNHHTARSRMMLLEAQVCGHSAPIQVEVTHRAETMSPIEQAKLIVSKANEARAFLEDVAPEELTQLEPNVIEVTCE